MKIALLGAGAIGCSLGAKLFSAGQDVTLIARGEHLKALQKHGLELTNTHPENQFQWTFSIPATDDPASIGTQDLIILSCKSYDLPAATAQLEPMLHEETILLPVCNGIPWWFSYEFKPLENLHIHGLDPDNQIAKHIAFSRVIGGLCYMGCGITAPGKVSLFSKRPFIRIGEPNGKPTDRVNKLAEVFEKSGFRDPLSKNIRGDIWQKLCWNIAFNPLSVLTGELTHILGSKQEYIEHAHNIMKEMYDIADKIGLNIEHKAAWHIACAKAEQGAKTSMLQDHERGKTLEIEAIIGAVAEIADYLHHDAPKIHDLYKRMKNIS